MYGFSSVVYKTDTEGDYMLHAKAYTSIEIIPSPSFFEWRSTPLSLPPTIQQDHLIQKGKGVMDILEIKP